MTTFGIDVSHYQTGLSLAQAKSAGAEFVIAKATEGQGWQDTRYAYWRAEAEKNGLLFAAYHFLRSDSLPADQAANALSVVGYNVPLILDVEPGTSGSNPTMAHVNAFKSAYKGKLSSLLYIPQWHWQAIGQPSLFGWATWQSRYGTNPVATAFSGYPGDDHEFWSAYGGAEADMLQYGSQGRFPGYAGNVDVNAFRGTRAELASKGWLVDYNKEADVALTAEDKAWIQENGVPLAKITTKVVPGAPNETQTLNWVLRNVIARLEKVEAEAAKDTYTGPSAAEIANEVVAVLPTDSDLTTAQVESAVASVLSRTSLVERKGFEVT